MFARFFQCGCDGKQVILFPQTGHNDLRRAGRPIVSVRSCRRTSVSISRSDSIACASRNSTPICAARPLATMIEIGVANPSAQGQAMMSTATALMMA